MFLGTAAGKCTTSGQCNTFLGFYTSKNNTTGCFNVSIGSGVDVASATGNKQLAIGCNTGRWITGDSNFKVGISSNITAPRAELEVAGSVHANRFFQNPTSLDTTISFPADGGAAVNGGVFGPYTVNTGVTFTIGSGSTFTII